MNITDRLYTIAVNEDRVYRAGMSRGVLKGTEEGYRNGQESGYRQGYEEAKTLYYANGYQEGFGEGKSEGVAEGQQIGYAQGWDAGSADGYERGEYAGKQAERDAFWDQYQQKGKRANYLYAFTGYGWTDEIYAPKYVIKPTTSFINVYAYSNITDTKVDIDVTGMGVNNINAFANAYNLKTIRKLIVKETVSGFSGYFDGCTALENITVEGVLGVSIDLHWSKKLTRESIESVIRALSDTVEGKTVTFSMQAVIDAFITESSNSDDWQALMATKPNWTFSLTT